MNSYRHLLSFMIAHPDADLSGVPVELNLPFKRLIKKGDPRVGKDGRTHGVYLQSRCDFDFKSAAILPDSLRAAVETLKLHQKYLIRLSDDGAKLRFFVGIFSEGINTGAELDWALLKEISDLRTSLDLDFYGPDDNVPAPEGNSDVP